MSDEATTRNRAKGRRAPRSPKANTSNLIEPEDESCLGTPEEIARDNAEWERAFASTTDEEYDALIESIRTSIRTNGTTPLDFNRK